MFETTELCRNVGFRDADNHRYLAVAMIIEVEKQKGAIEKIIFLAQAEIAKLRKQAKAPKAPTR